jgi:hypothetical protein
VAGLALSCAVAAGAAVYAGTRPPGPQGEPLADAPVWNIRGGPTGGKDGRPPIINTADLRLAGMQDDLVRGEPKILIRNGAEPEWMKWVVGGGKSNLEVVKRSDPADGKTKSTVLIHTAKRALLELLPDPGYERYTISARLLHDAGQGTGEVGVYVGRVEYQPPNAPRPVHFYTNIAFNTVAPRGQGLTKQRAELIPVLIAEAGEPEFYPRFPGRPGPELNIVFGGGAKAVWHTVEVTVTPEGVGAKIDGEPFAITRESIEKSVRTGLLHPTLRVDRATFVEGLRPEFRPRGGVGLVLWQGSAAVGDVTITPLSVRN